MKLFFTSLLMGFALSAQSPAPPVKPGTPNVVTAEHRAVYWKAIADKQSADTIYDNAVKALFADCKDQKLTTDSNREPICVIPPPPVEPQAAPAQDKKAKH